jgi:hypothetical protein
LFSGQKLRARKGLPGSSGIRAFSSGIDRSDDLIVVIIKVGQCRIDFFGAKIGMLTQQFFRGRSEMIVLSGEMLDLVARVTNPRDSVVANSNVRVNRRNTHEQSPLQTRQNTIGLYEIPNLDQCDDSQGFSPETRSLLLRLRPPQ